MALTKTVTKLWPSLGNDGRTYTVGIHLVLQDDGVTKIDQDFTATYGGVGEINIARDKVIVEAQTTIDKYKAEKTINNATAYTNAVSAINTALIL
jgi:hypothetical protein